MKCCIVGAGATGGHLAVKLQRAGHQVSVLARGAQLAAIQAGGLSLEVDGHLLNAPVHAAHDPAELGAQDLVFITTKATALQDIVPRLAPLVELRTTVAFLQNGMPWWYPTGLPADRPLPPAMSMFRQAPAFLRVMNAEQVLGGIVYTANEAIRPGVIRNNSPLKNAVELGAIDDVEREGLVQARAALEGAGIESAPIPDIRAAMWTKLIGNAAASSLCVCTGNPGALLKDPLLKASYVRLIEECLQVAVAHGYDVADQLDMTRLTQHRSRHKPSMLQDYEAGRPMELEEMVLAPIVFARAVNLATPTLDAVGAIAMRLATDKGLFSARASLVVSAGPR